MRVLITGATGQDGYYLSKTLSLEHDVWGLYRGQEEARLAALRQELPLVEWVRGDITDAGSVSHAIWEIRPDWIFNLAAASFVGLSWQMARLYMETDAGGVLNVLEAARQHVPQAHILQASTSEMFGSSSTPLSETSPMLPKSPYGVAKLAAHHLCRVYRESYGMHISCAISFNHESPRRPPIFVTRKVTQAVAAIAAGHQDSLTLTTLDSWRDWGHAEDYMRAYILMAQAEEPDDYVVATGVTHSISELVGTAFRAAGISDWSNCLRVDETQRRPNELVRLDADPSRIRSGLGWEAQVSFEELIREMVAHDMENIAVTA